MRPQALPVFLSSNRVTQLLRLACWTLLTAFGCSTSPNVVPSVQSSVLTVMVDQVAADGVARAAVQLSLRDEDGALMPQAIVTFVGNANATLIQPGVTDADGNATLLLTAQQAGIVNVGAQVLHNGAWRILAQTVDVAFVQDNAVDSNGLSLALDVDFDASNVADGNSQAMLTLSVLDGNGRVLVGSPVTLQTDGVGTVLTPSSGVTSSLGTFNATLSSTQSRPVKVTASVGQSSVDAMASFVAGPMDLAHCSLAVQPNHISGDGVSFATLTLQVADAFANPVANFAVSWDSNDSSASLVPDAPATNGAGLASAAFASTQLGTVQVRAHLGEQTLQVPVVVGSILPSALFSRMVVQKREVQADGISGLTVTITVLDAARNPIADHPVSLTSSDPRDVFDPPSGLSDGNGVFATTLRSQRAGAKSLTGTLGNQFVGATATFVPLDADPVQSTFAASTTQASVGNVMPVKLTLQARDMHGDAAAFEPVSLSVVGVPATVTPTGGITDENGYFTALFTSTLNGNSLAVATLRSTQLSVLVHFVAGSPVAQLSTLTTDADVVVADGLTSAGIVATFYDAYGNVLLDCPDDFSSNGNGVVFSDGPLGDSGLGSEATNVTSTRAQTVMLRAGCQGVTVSTPMLFIAGPAQAANSSLRATPQVGVADGHSAVTMSVAVKDAQNNPVPGQTVSLLVNSNDAQLAASSGITASDGTYSTALRANSVGDYLVQAQFNGATLTTPVSFLADTPNALLSTLTAEPNQLQADGLSSTALTLVLRDAAGLLVANQNVNFWASGANNVFSAAQRRTDASGKASIRLASIKAETKRFAAQAANVTVHGGNVVFTCGAADAGSSLLTVVSQPVWTVGGVATAVANGQPALTVQLRVADAAGNPIPNLAVGVTSSNGQDLLVPLSASTNANGLWTAQLASSVAGLRTLQVTAGPVVMTAQANLVAGPLAQAHSSLSLANQNVLADNVAVQLATVQLRDAFNNPLAGQAVQWSSPGSSANFTLTPLAAVTDAQGLAQATLSSPLAGLRALQVVAGGFAASANTVFVAGPFSPVQSQLVFVANPAVADGNDAVKLLIYIRDAQRNPIANDPVAASSTVASDVVQRSGSATAADGTMTITLRGTVAGPRFLLLGGEGNNADAVPVSLVAGRPSSNCVVTLVPNALTVGLDNAATVSVQAIDALGNLVANQNVALQVSGLGSVLGQSLGVTDAQGRFVTTLSATLAQTAQVTASIGNQAPISKSASVTFMAGGVAAAGTTSDLVPAAPQAGQTANYTLHVVDAFGNPVVGAAVSLLSNIASDALLPSLGATDGNGNFASQVSFTEAGERQLIRVVGNVAQTDVFSVSAASANGLLSTLVGQPAVVQANGVDAASFTLLAKDAYGNAAANQYVQVHVSNANTLVSATQTTTDGAGVMQFAVRANKVGSTTVQALVGGALLQQPVLFVAGPADFGHSLWSSSPTSQVADGNQTVTLTLQLADAFGNPVANQQALVAASGTGNVLDFNQLATDGQGRLQVKLSSSTAATKQVSAAVAGLNFVTPVIFVPGLPTASNSSLQVLPASIAADPNAVTTLTLVVRDASGNPVPNVAATLSASGNSTLLVSGPVTNAQGAVTATFTALHSGTAALSASVGGAQGFVLNTNLTVAAGAANLALSHLSVLPSPVLANAVANANVQVRVLDALGNPVVGQAVSLAATGGNNCFGATTGSTDANGCFNTPLTSHKAELKTVTAQAGALTLAGNVLFLADVLDLNHSLLSFSAAAPVADGTSAVQASVSLADAHGNPIVGQLVTLTSTDASDLFGPASCTTGATGGCAVAITSVHAGARTISAGVGAGGNVPLTAPLTFVADVVNASHVSLLYSPNVVVADGNAKMRLSVWARDAQNNPVANAAVSLVGVGSDLQYSPGAQLATDANGLATLCISATLAGARQLGVSVAGSLFETHPVFAPGAADANASTYVTSTTQLVADGVSKATITLVARDAFGNAVPGLPVSLASTSGNVLVTPNNPVTDATGQIQVQVSSLLATTKCLRASFAGLVKNIDIRFVAGAPSALFSTLVASPNLLLADANQQALLTLRAQDAVGNPAANQTVQVFAQGSNVLLTGAAASTDANGLWTASLGSTTAQLITAQVQTGALQLSVPVQILPGLPNAATSTAQLVGSTPVADGNSFATFRVVLRDAADNLLAGVPVSFAVSGNQASFSTPQANTNAAGEASAGLTSTLAGAKTVTLQAGTLSWNLPVTFVAGAAQAATSTFTASAPSLVADGNAFVLLSFALRDAAGNPVANAAVTFDSSGGQNTFAQGTSATDGNGLATVQFSSVQAQTKVLTASAAGVQLSLTLPLTPGPVVAANATLLAQPTSQLADGTSATHLVLTLRDAQANLVPNALVTWSSSGNGSFSAPTSTTGPAGTASVDYVSQQTGVQTLSALGGAVSTQVSFYAGQANATTSQLSVSLANNANCLVADGNSLATLVLALRDAYNSPVVGHSVQWLGGGAGDVLLPQALVTDGNGLALATVSAVSAGSKAYSAQVDGLVFNANVRFVAGAATATTSVLSVTPPAVLADGNTPATVGVRVLDAQTNPVQGVRVQLATGANQASWSGNDLTTDAQGSVTAQLRSNLAQTQGLTATVSQAGTSFALQGNVSFLAGSANAALSRLRANPNTLVANANQQATITLTLQDSFANPLGNQLVQFSALGQNVVLVPNANVTDAMGHWSGTLTSTVAQNFNAVVNAAGLQLLMPIFVLPGQASLANSTAQLSGAPYYADGNDVADLDVVIRDASGNPLANVAVVITADGSGNLFVPPSVNTNAAGEASVSLTSTVAQYKTISISAAGLTWSLPANFVPGSPIDGVATLVAQGNANTLVADGNATLQVIYTLVDAVGNPIPGESVTFTATGTANQLAGSANAVTDANGQAAILLSSTRAETKGLAAVAAGKRASLQVVTVAGPPVAANATLLAQPGAQLADGSSPIQTLLSLRDATGNPVPNYAVTWNASGNAHFSSPTSTTDASGAASVTLVSGTVGAQTVSVLAGQVSTPVSFYAGVGNLTTSVLSHVIAGGGNDLVANGVASASLVLQLRDAFGNPAAGRSVVWGGTLAGDVLVPASVTDVHGLATATVTGTLAGTRTYTASVDDLMLTTCVNFQADVPTAATSQITLAPSSVVADGNSQITASVLLLDAHANPVSNAQVQFATLASQASWDTNQVTTSPSGAASAKLRASVAQVAPVVASVTLGATQFSLQANVTFVPGAPSLVQSSWQANPNLLVANANQQAQLTLALKDALNNPLVNQNVQFSTLGQNVTLQATASTTDANGLWTAALTSNLAQVLDATVNAAGLQWTTPVSVVAGAATLGQSSAVQTGVTTGTLANGNDTAVLHLVVRDASGNPLVGVPVSLLASGGNNVYSPTNLLTSSTGDVTVRVSNTVAQTENITLSAAGLQWTLPISFVAGAANAATSTLTSNVSSLLADGNAVAQLTFVLRDALGNPVAGQPVSFAATGSANQFGGNNAATDANGQVVVTLSSTTAQAKTVSASGGSVQLMVPVTFLAGNPLATHTSFTVQPNTQLADGNSAVNVAIVVRDALNNPVPNQPVQWTASGLGTFGSPNSTTNLVGAASTTFVSTHTGAQTLAALSGAVSGQVSFYAGALNANNTQLLVTVAGGGNSLVANGNAAATLTLRVADALGNPVPNRTVQWSGALAGDVFGQTSGTTDANGVVTTQVTGTKAGNRTYTAAVDGSTFAAGVRLVADTPTLASSSLLVLPVGVAADGIAQQSAYVWVLDPLGNPVGGANVLFATQAVQASFDSHTVSSDATGFAVAKVQSTVAQTQPLTAQVLVGSANFTLQGVTTFVAASPNVNHSSWLADSNVVVADAHQAANFTLTLRDNQNNVVANNPVVVSSSGVAICSPAAGATDANGQFGCALRSGVAATQNVTIDFGSGQMARSIQFVPGPAAASQTFLTAAPTWVVADGVSRSTLLLQVADANHNAVAGEQVTFACSDTNLAITQVSPASCTTLANGSATAAVVSSQAQNLLITATLAPSGLQLQVPVSFVAGAPSNLRTTLVASPNEQPADGNAVIVLTAQVLDATGNPVQNLLVALADGGPVLNANLPSSGTTNAAGQFSVPLTTTQAGPRNVTLSAGAAIATAKFAFVPGAIDANASSFAGPSQTTVADASTQAKFVVVLKDKLGNTVAGGNVTFAVSSGNALLAATSASTDLTGTATTTLTSAVLGSKTVTASWQGGQLQAVANFVAGSPNSQTTTLVCSPNTLVADANAATTCIVLASDSFGNPVANQNVVMSAGAAGPNFAALNGLTALDGTFSTTVSCAVAQDSLLRATLGPATATSLVHFVPGPISLANSTFTINPNQLVANGNNQTAVRLKLVDAQNNRIPNVQVTYTVTGSGGLWMNPTVTTNSLGIAMGYLASTVAELKTITATAAGQQWTMPVTFVPGAVSATTSSLLASPNQAVADANAAVSLVTTLRDANSNPVPNQLVTYTVSGTGNTLGGLTATTNASGVASLGLRSSVAENKVVTAVAAGISLGQNVLFVPGAISAGQSTWTADRSSLTADGTTTAQLTLKVRDALGNPVVGVPVTFSSSGSGAVLLPAGSVTNAQGQLGLGVSSLVAEVKTLQASFAGLSPTLNLTFLPGPAATATSTFTSDANWLVADGVQHANLALQIRDAYNNLVAGQAVSLATGGGNAVVLPPSGSTDANGTYLATLSSSHAELSQVTATAGAATLAQQVRFVAGPASAGRSLLTLSPNTLPADATTTTRAVLVLLDATGNPVANANVGIVSSDAGGVFVPPAGVTDATGSWTTTLASANAGVARVTAQAANLTFCANATFVAGPATAANSTLTVNANVQVANGNNGVPLSLVVRDGHGNLLANQNVVLSSTGSNNVFVPPGGVTDGNGVFAATLKSTTAETKTLSAAFAGVVLSAQATFGPGPATLATSSLVVSPSQILADGASAATATVVLLDANQNPLVNQSVAWSSTGSAVSFLAATLTTNAQGKATAQVVSTKAQQISLNVTAGGLPLNAPLTFMAGAPSASTSQWLLNPNVAVVADGNAVANLTAVALDAFGNPLANQTVTFATLSGNSTFTPPSGLTDANGMLATLLRSTKAEIKQVRATIGTGTGAPSLTLDVTFVAGAPSSTVSTFQGSPPAVTADGNSLEYMLVTVLDAFANPVVNQNVSLTASGTLNTFSPPSGVTDSVGNFQSTVSSVRAQTETITAWCGPAGATKLTLPVVFKAGAVSTGNVTFAVSPNVVTASSSDNVAIDVTLLDARLNPVPNVATTFATSLGNANFSSTSVNSDANGKVHVGLHSTLAQTGTVSVYFGSASLTAGVTVVPAAPSAAMSSLVATPNTAVANGTAPITVALLAKDAFANLVGTLPVTLAYSGSVVSLTASSGNTALGAFSSQVASTVAQLQNVTATVGSTSPAVLTAQLNFVAGPPVAAKSSLQASPNSFVADNVATSTVTCLLRDAYNNLVPGQNVTIAVPGTNVTLATPAGTTSALGVFAATLKTTRAQALVATATVNGNFALTANAVAVPGPTAALTLTGLAGGISAVTSSPQVQAWDVYGNLTPAYTGTVAFSTADTSAVLPASYAFTALDAGSHTFANAVTLVTPATQQVTVQDTNTVSLQANQNNLVISAPVFSNVTVTTQGALANCLELQGGVTSSNATVVNKSCSNAIAQVFGVGTDNTLRVLGRCVEVTGGTYTSGQAVQTTACTATPRQRWTWLSNGTVASVGNSNFCLEVQAANAGTAAVIKPCLASNANQQLAVRAASPLYTLVNGPLQQVLEVANSNYVAGTPVRNNTYLNAANQGFAYGQDRSLNARGYCLQPAGGTLANGAALQLASCSGNAVQQFVFDGNALQAASNTTLCVDVGSSATPTGATFKTCNLGATQNLGAVVQALRYRYVPLSAAATGYAVDAAAALNGTMVMLQMATLSPTRNQSFALNPSASQDVTMGALCTDTQVGLLNLLGLSSYNGQQLYVNSCSTSITQNWRSLPLTPTTYQLKWQATGNYCMNASPTLADTVQLGTCNTVNTNQAFYQLAQSFVLQSAANSNQCVDVTGGLPVAGAAVQFSACSSTATSQAFTAAVDNSLQFNGLCFDVAGGVAAGNPVKLATCNYLPSQAWVFGYSAASQSVGTISPASNTALCLDPSGAATGSAVKLVACSGATSQTFNLH